MRNVPKAGRVYIAGPYSTGDQALNVRTAILAADQVYADGYYPYVPHLTHFWHMLKPRTYEQWLDLDLQWLAMCHALIRLPGESRGADREVAYALRIGLPVFLGMEDWASREGWNGGMA